MLQNRALRYIVYGASAVVISEVLLYVYERIQRRVNAIRGLEGDKEQDELVDVVWTNELIESCTGIHIDDDWSKRSSQTNGQKKLVATAICTNPFCVKRNVGRLIDLIDKCNYTIDLAVFTFTSLQLSDALLRAMRRGVVLRIISDKEMVFSSGSQIMDLACATAAVRCPTSTMLMHHKFCILDGPTRIDSLLKNTNKKPKKNIRCVLFTGSPNWTMQGFSGNWENVIIISNKSLITKYENEFQRMWSAMGHVAASNVMEDIVKKK